MSWTKVNKPTSGTYTNVNPLGKTQYDQSNIDYDSATMFYDGVNPNQWTDISKPTSSTWTKVNKPT